MALSKHVDLLAPVASGGRVMPSTDRDELWTRGALAALDAIETGVVLLDADMTIRWVNDAFATRVQGPSVPIHGQPFSAFSSELAVDVERLERTLSEGQGWSDDLHQRTSDGALRRVHVRVEPVHDEHQRVLGVLVLLRDEDELHRLRAVAAAVNLATNVGQMFAGIRHELGNPVNSLKTALTVLQSKWLSFAPSHVDYYLERMLVELGRVEHLLRSLRSFSAFEDLQLGRVSPDEAVAEMLRVLQRPAAERALAVRVEAEPGLVVRADGRALYQVLLNLLTNAMDAAHSEILIRVGRWQGCVALEIIDDGEGISATELAVIRRPFYTTKGHGTGLGLTITERLIAEMEGTLEIDSCPGRTTMRVVLEELDAHA